MRNLSVWFFTMFLGLCMVVFAHAETQVFELQHLQASSLEATVRAIIDEQSRVATFQNNLVVVATPEELATVAELVERLDRPVQMLRISVEQGHDDASRESGQSVSGRVGNESVVFRTRGRDGRPQDGVADVTVRSGDSRVRLRAEESRFHETRHVSQFLMVMEGQAGRLSVGKAVPFTERMVELFGRHHRVLTSTEYQRVDTGFYVYPEVYGDVVELDVQPFMASLDRSRPDEVIFQELSTRVRVPLGEWFDLGGHMSTRDELSREILSRGRLDGRLDTNIRIKVDPQ